jgi:hypothetical protein
MYDGKITIATELDTKSVDAQINKLENDLQIMTKSLETDLQIPVELRMSESERLKLESDIERTKNRIISLKESMNDAGDEGNVMNEKISKGFNRGEKSLKKFALSLFGIQSIYRLVSKASSSYLSQDTELAQKLQNVWVGLGSFLEPLLNAMSNALLKGLGYLNVFVKALTGVDYIARANAKALNKQTEAQKKLNKATQDYDFDVIRKQQDVSSSASSGDDYSGIEIPELDDRIVKKLQNLAKWLKENENLVKAVGIALGVTFGAIAIAKLIANIGSLIGTASAGTGLAGLSSVLGALGQIGIIAISVSLIYSALTGRDLVADLKEIKQGLIDLNDNNKNLIETTRKGAEESKNWADEMKNTDEVIKNKSVPDLDTMVDKIDTFTGNISDNIDKYKEWNSKVTENSDEYEINKNRIDDNMSRLDGYKAILENIKEKLENDNEELDKNSDRYKTNNELLDKTKKSLDKIDGYKATASVELYGKPKGFLAEIKDAWNAGNFSTLWKILMPGSIVNMIPGFAKGGIVTQPTRALIGEAGYPEAVVPMTQDYLSTLASEIGKYSGDGNGGVTNIYLDGRLIQRQVQNIKQNKDFATNS